MSYAHACPPRIVANILAMLLRDGWPAPSKTITARVIANRSVGVLENRAATLAGGKSSRFREQAENTRLPSHASLDGRLSSKVFRSCPWAS